MPIPAGPIKMAAMQGLCHVIAIDRRLIKTLLPERLASIHAVIRVSAT